MSEVTLFQNGAALPAHLRRGELSAATKSLMGGGVGKRISIEAGAWRMIVGGQEVAVNEDRAMNVIIVRAAEHNSRTYYEGTYKKGVKSKPTCWSNDSKTPDPSVKNPQSTACATCPQNIKGSGAGEGRACRYSRKLAVVLENDVHGDVYAMSVPAASIFGQGEGRKMGLQQYARFLGGHGTDVTAVVTEMRFDTQAEGVKINFSAVRPTTEDEFNEVLRKQNTPEAIDAVTMTVSQIDGDDTPAASAPAPAAAPVAAPVAAPAPAPAKAAKSGFQVTKAKKEEPAAEVVDEPQVRAAAPRAAVSEVDDILSKWSDDTDD